ncbi:hypothetical protein B4N89_07440 [Embleya scabrispora]|uniref:Uncharacterized protein n=1 Tax=Embleya scabrispora TaxID=159449 RepID=A0A1T3NVG8_9ACTN|nr:hypothetical protein B4N89_07440 [Embleya scabrispora]
MYPGGTRLIDNFSSVPCSSISSSSEEKVAAPPQRVRVTCSRPTCCSTEWARVASTIGSSEPSSCSRTCAITCSRTPSSAGATSISSRSARSMNS